MAGSASTVPKLLRACSGSLAMIALSAPLQASPIEVSTSGHASITQRPTGGGLPLTYNGSVIDVNLADPNGVGAGVTATALETASSILFGSSAITAGGFARAVSTSSVDITLTNPYDTAILPQLSSVVIPASIGFMMAESAQCGGANLFACIEFDSVGFDALQADSQQPLANALAYSRFTFEVSSEGQQIYSITAAISLVRDASGDVGVVTDVDDAAATLLNFGLLTPQGSDTAYVLGWDATPLDLPFPDDVTTLAPGASRTLTYSVTTESWTRAAPLELYDRAFLLAFSGIGDPCCQGGKGAQFSQTPYEFGLPVLTGDTVTLLPGVPEPASWAMMVAGFGLLGTAARRRRRIPA